jgi:hypothetical protein
MTWFAMFGKQKTSGVEMERIITIMNGRKRRPQNAAVLLGFVFLQANSTSHATKRNSQYQKENGTISFLLYTQGGIELLHTSERTARNCA